MGLRKLNRNVMMRIADSFLAVSWIQIFRPNPWAMHDIESTGWEDAQQMVAANKLLRDFRVFLGALATFLEVPKKF